MRANPPSLRIALSAACSLLSALSGCGAIALSQTTEPIEAQGHIDDPTLGGTYPLPDLELQAATLTPSNRMTLDQADTLKGFQLHPIYVVPSGNPDEARDITGEIGMLLSQAVRIQEALFGHHIQIDRRLDGSFDVSFLASKHAESELFGEGARPGRLLLQEYLDFNHPGPNRKLYVFLVEAPLQTTQRESYCGLTPLHKGYFAWHSTILLGEGCSGVSDAGVHYPARALVHEVLHGLGVDTHSATSTDILCGFPYTCIAGGAPVADRIASHYFFGDGGVDVAELRVWEGHLDNALLDYPCSRSFETSCGLEERRVILSKVCYQHLEPAEILWLSESGAESSSPALMTIDASCPREAPFGVSAMVSAARPTTLEYRVRVGGSIGTEPRRIHFQH